MYKRQRLKYAYIIKCEDYIKDEATGEIKEIFCTYDPDSASGGPTANRKVKGTLHWVEESHAVDGEVHLMGDLLDFSSEAEDIVDQFNPDSLKVLTGVKLDPSMVNAPQGQTYQFLRKGYFCVDSKYSKLNAPVFVETVSLKDSFKG